MARSQLLSVIASSIVTGLKSVVGVTSVPATAVSQGTWWGSVRESFSGAWQSRVAADPHHTLLAFSAVYACVTLISEDIAKLRIKLMTMTRDGIWQETSSPAFSPVLRKPNHYQTRIQFLSQWVMSKLIHGNTYILKERDARGVVVALYVLDPRMVKALVTDSGDVYYQVGRDRLTGSQESVTIPASEIIHDRAICFFHPLIGIGPIYACGISATQGIRIQGSSAKFFENMSRPSGMLTAPDTITDETAARLKAEFEANFSGSNIGRLLVSGDGLKYEPMTIPAQQAQLIEQLRWTVEDVARCFHVPLHKIASDSGIKFNNMAAMNQDYYSQTLQALIESIELLLDEGLGLTGGTQTLGVELDLEGLLRMDPIQRAQRNEINVKAGIWSPDEARATDNMVPVKGGSEPFLQQQNFPLSVLVQQPPPGSMPPAPPAPLALPAPTSAADAQAAAKAARDLIEASAAADTRMHGYVEAMKSMADAAAQREREARESHAAMLSAAKSIGDNMAQKPAASDDESDADDVQQLAAALIAKFTSATHVV